MRVGNSYNQDSKSPPNIKFHPQIVTIFSYSKKSLLPSSRAQPPPVRLLRTGPAPCKVLSSSKVALSTPLTRYTYSQQHKAFSNQEGLTWTPSYLRYCQPTLTQRFFERNRDVTCDKATSDHPTIPYTMLHKVTPSTQPKYHQDTRTEPGVMASMQCGCDANRAGKKQQTSYSKFMESPYLRKRPSYTREQPHTDGKKSSYSS